MIQSISIRNYRSLKELDVKQLSRVNLIIGKNNVGKSSLLEAIAIYATKFSFTFLEQLIDERGEYAHKSKNKLEERLKSFTSIFTHRIAGFELKDALVIAAKTERHKEIRNEYVSVNFFNYVVDDGAFQGVRKIENGKTDNLFPYSTGLEIRVNSEDNLLTVPLGTQQDLALYKFHEPEMCELVAAGEVNGTENDTLWDKIALTDKEDYVIEALKIIDPKIERVSFVDYIEEERNAVVRLKDNNVVSLKSMGGGVNRILTIILSMVNCENGYLLIDEFENGLHFSVQEKLWEIIFRLASQLNVQVFATTHSEDCIRGFEGALNAQEDTGAGKLIRLDYVNGKIVEAEYDAELLKIATTQNVDIR